MFIDNTKPKTLIITCLITTIGLTIYMFFGNIDLIDISNFETLTHFIYQYLISGCSIVLMLYCIFVLLKKANMKILNSILLISILIKIIYEVCYIIFSFINTGIVIDEVGYILSILLSISLITILLTQTINAYMIHGILKKKNIPYKKITHIAITLILIFIFIQVVGSIKLLWNTQHIFYGVMSNVLYYIIIIINTCSFTLFLYQYGNSIKGGIENE